MPAYSRVVPLRLWCAFPRWWRRRGKALTAAALTTSSGLCNALENTNARHVSHTPRCGRAKSDTQSAWISAAATTHSLTSGRRFHIGTELEKLQWLDIQCENIYLNIQFQWSREVMMQGNTHSNSSWVSEHRHTAVTGILHFYTLRPSCSRTPREETAERTLAAGAPPHCGCSLDKIWSNSFNGVGLISTPYFRAKPEQRNKKTNKSQRSHVLGAFLWVYIIYPYLSGRGWSPGLQ